MSASPSPHAAAQGFRRLQVGDIEVFALSDGRQDLPLSLFASADAVELARLAEAAGFAPGVAPVSINAFTIRTGNRLCLVDAGSGASRGTHVGHVPRSLAAAGLDPGAIDTVLMTHMHGDHAGGLLGPDGAPAFPHAELLLAKDEEAFWTDEGLPARSPERMQPTIANTVAALAAYRTRTRTFAADDEVAPGVTAIAIPGHTPGQTAFMVESRGERLLIWADIIHVEAFQFSHPDWPIGFDVDGRLAAETRAAIFARVADEDLLVAGMHLDFPGIGKVVREGGAYAFRPIATE